jgi:hypothetical protein
VKNQKALLRIVGGKNITHSNHAEMYYSFEIMFAEYVKFNYKERPKIYYLACFKFG